MFGWYTHSRTSKEQFCPERLHHQNRLVSLVQREFTARDFWPKLKIFDILENFLENLLRIIITCIML